MRPFFPDFENRGPKYVSELTYWESKLHKRDWMTEELPPKDLAGFVRLSNSVSQS